MTMLLFVPTTITSTSTILLLILMLILFHDIQEQYVYVQAFSLPIFTKSIKIKSSESLSSSSLFVALSRQKSRLGATLESDALLLNANDDNNNNNNDINTKSNNNFKNRKNDNNELYPYNWKNQWYALTFADYVPNPSESAEPIAASVFGHPLVLWRSQENGIISCADDICPHRSAALSEGRVRDGRIECLYHGWQFRAMDEKDEDDSSAGSGGGGGGGSCARIPQLKVGATIPKRACLTMRPTQISDGIVWAWMGDDSPTTLPPSAGIGLNPQDGTKKGWNIYRFQSDLPYDHSFLIENLLDPAHAAISHDRTYGGGRREDAQPYEMIVESMDVHGFRAKFRNAGPKVNNNDNNNTAPFMDYNFVAPGILYSKAQYKSMIFGGALHCMPLGFGRSRLLFMFYNTGLPWIANVLSNAKPMWLRFMNSCKVLEQDLSLITTQEDHFVHRNPHRKLQDDYLLLTTSDKFVGAYRKWLDRVGHGMPWFQGLSSSLYNNDGTSSSSSSSSSLTPALHPAANRGSSEERLLETRYHRHVIHSPISRRALKNIRRIKIILMSAAILATGVAISIIPSSTLSSSYRHQKILRIMLKLLGPSIPFFALCAAGFHTLEQHFYVSFKRKLELRKQRGDDKF